MDNVRLVFEWLHSLFGNPFFSAVVGFLGLYLSWHFYRKQMSESNRLEGIIARLQEENAQLRDKIDDEAIRITDPSRAQTMLRLRDAIQNEDTAIPFRRDDLPALVITLATWVALGFVGYYLERTQKGLAAFAFMLISAIPLMFIAAFISRRLNKRINTDKNERMRNALVAAKLSLTEVDNLRNWIRSRQWLYFNQGSMLRAVDSWVAAASDVTDSTST